jgi:hypothetical protein
LPGTNTLAYYRASNLSGLGRKRLTTTNTPAYYATELITTVKKVLQYKPLLRLISSTKPNMVDRKLFLLEREKKVFKLKQKMGEYRKKFRQKKVAKKVLENGASITTLGIMAVSITCFISTFSINIIITHAD